MTELHGGNIYRFAEALDIDENEIVDFSASINPLGPPKSVISAIKKQGKYLFNYPDPDAKQLIQAIAKHLGIDPQSVICGNGSTELIYLVARALKPERVLIPAPTFSEYERAYKRSNELRVTRYELKKEESFDINPDRFIEELEKLVTRHLSPVTNVMAFLCNPNNPTGRLLKKKDVLKIAAAAKKNKSYLVVDEAFIDFTPEESVVRNVEDNPYLIVLRSMTKIYALSGLRIGYGIFQKNLIRAMHEQKEPWTVNTLAQKAGITALNDRAYVKKTLALIKREKKFLERGFEKTGIKFFHSDTNFYLLKIGNAVETWKKLRDKGILVRDCSNFVGLDESYVRVAVKSNADNKRLLKELEKLCGA